MTKALARHLESPLLIPLLLVLLTVIGIRPGAAQPQTSGFTFVYGLDRSSALAVLQQLNFNTLYLDLHPSDLGDLQPCCALIRAAHQRGLKVIIGLPTCLTPAYRVSPYDPTYTGAVAELVKYLVGQLKGEAGVTAWGTGHFLEKHISYNDADFRLYLQKGYPSLTALNASWGADFQTWQQPTMKSVQGIDAAQPYGIGRASLDLADYKAYAFGQVMKLWLDDIRSVDPHRPVFTGRISLYRSLLSIPNGYDTVVVSMPPDVLEHDLDTHNVQAVDIARRGGKFHVIQTLRCPPGGGQEEFPDWIMEAAIHGASGIAIEDWSRLALTFEGELRRPPNRRPVINALQAAGGMPFDFRPQPTAAVIYSPYAEGFSVTRQPVYGYLTDYLSGEPSTLIDGLRFGTCFGTVDYLSPQDLETAPLDRYGTLLAPACLKLSPAQSERLHDYLRDGGSLVADLGLGMYQTASWLSLPRVLQGDFGLVSLQDVQDRAGDMTVGTAVAGLPSLRRGMTSHGVFRAAGKGTTAPATSLLPHAVSGPTVEAKLADDAVAFAPMTVRFDKQHKPFFTGLSCRHCGEGLAIFATYALWQYWPLTDPMSAALHGDLLARRADYELVQKGLLQSHVLFAGNRDEVALANPERLETAAKIWAFAAANRAYQGGAIRFEASPTQQGLPAGTGLLVATIPAGQVRLLPARPLVAEPYSDDVAIQLQDYSPQRVVFSIAGAGATLMPGPGGRMRLSGEAPVQVRLVLKDGDYHVAPGSRHEVTVTPEHGKPQTALVRATAAGELDLSGTYYRTETITIQPVR